MWGGGQPPGPAEQLLQQPDLLWEQQHTLARATPSLGWERGEPLAPSGLTSSVRVSSDAVQRWGMAPRAPWLFMVRNVFATC